MKLQDEGWDLTRDNFPEREICMSSEKHTASYHFGATLNHMFWGVSGNSLLTQVDGA